LARQPAAAFFEGLFLEGLFVEALFLEGLPKGR
jgi:hypothetical protein